VKDTAPGRCVYLRRRAGSGGERAWFIPIPAGLRAGVPRADRAGGDLQANMDSPPGRVVQPILERPGVDDGPAVGGRQAAAGVYVSRPAFRPPRRGRSTSRTSRSRRRLRPLTTLSGGLAKFDLDPAASSAGIPGDAEDRLRQLRHGPLRACPPRTDTQWRGVRVFLRVRCPALLQIGGV